MTNETEMETPELTPRQKLEKLWDSYVGKTLPPAVTGSQIREALRATPAYRDAFAQAKDEAMALDDMGLQTLKNQKVPAWLINPDLEKEYKGVKKGHGALFRLASGVNHFVDMKGPMPNAPPILTEFVFSGATVFRNIFDGSEDYDWNGAKPVQEKHGASQPNSDLSKAIASCWKYNAKKGVVIGESYDTVFAVLSITGNEDDIRHYPANEFSDKPTLRFLANDSAGNVVQVETDPADTARQVGMSAESPAKLWKTRLRGAQIAANGKLSVFMDRGDKFFGGDGVLANFAAQQGSRIKDLKDGKKAMSLADLYNATTNAHPTIAIGDKHAYRLEAYLDRDGNERWKGYVRADSEVDQQGRPQPPTLNCIVKTGTSKKGPYTINEGAFVTFLGASDGVRKPTAQAQSLLTAE